MNITYKACRNTLGECSNQEYKDYKSLLMEALEEAFPGANVDVEDSDFANESQIETDGDNREAIEDISQRVYESGEWFGEEE